MRADLQDMLNMLPPVSELSEWTTARGPVDNAHKSRDMSTFTAKQLAVSCLASDGWSTADYFGEQQCLQHNHEMHCYVHYSAAEPCTVKAKMPQQRLQ